MRDVTLEEPSATEIPRRERFTPEAIVVRMPEWRRREDGSGELLVERTGKWGRIDPMFVAALDAIGRGERFLDVLALAEKARPDVKPNHVRILLRRFYWQLHEAGHLRIPLEEPPSRFAGRYRLVRTLGRGGVGVAHLCHDEREDRLVVVKHAWGYQQPIDRTDRGMRKEGEALRAMEHPGIARFYDEFEVEGLYHVVREYVDGTPLHEVVRRDGRLPRATRLELLGRIADILRHMHERGYLFLDSKPDNFLLRPDASLIVADLGTCRPHVNGRAAYDGQSGSRGYTAPEVIARENVGAWSDVFGFGCVHEFLLTGRAPTHKATPEERAAALEAAGAPSDERALVMACCADDPSERPAGMAELARRVRSLRP